MEINPTASQSPATSPRRIAVLVCHGMGKQVCYETVDGIAEAIVKEHAAQGLGHKFSPQPVKHAVSTEAQAMARAELALQDPVGQTHEVHLYEAYWAPLTEGKITLIETVRFLLRTGWNGLKYCARERQLFMRWTFGEERTYNIKQRTPISVAAALTLVCLIYGDLLALVLSLPAALCYYFFQIGHTNRESIPAVSTALLWLKWCVWDFATVSAILILAFVVFAIFQAVPVLRQLMHSAIRNINSFSVALTTGVVLAICTRIPAISVVISEWWETTAYWTTFLNRHPWIMMIGLPLAFWIWKELNYFMVEFVGDVAIYVSANSLDTFWKVREEIKRVCLDAATAIYATKSKDERVAEYNEIIILGHSLGSVIAYDTLNTLIGNDILHESKVKVVDRTTHLITYGSPLDKVAFLFQSQGIATPYRNALDASLQPLVFDEAFRRHLRWTNIRARFDIISGELNYYDDDSWQSGDKRSVLNLVEQDAPWNPAVAHTAYLDRTTLPRVIYFAVMGLDIANGKSTSVD